MGCYLTCGQAAKRLKVSISTLKRWVSEPELGLEELRNRSGWRLFSEEDVGNLRDYKMRMRRAGKRYTDLTLLPTTVKKKNQVLRQSSNMQAIA